METKHSLENRLKDIIAIAQVLAMDPDDVSGRANALRNPFGDSQSALDNSWPTIAKHREFFGQSSFALVATRSEEQEYSKCEHLRFHGTKLLIDAAHEQCQNQLTNRNASQRKSINKAFLVTLSSVVISTASVASSSVSQEDNEVCYDLKGKQTFIEKLSKATNKSEMALLEAKDTCFIFSKVQEILVEKLGVEPEEVTMEASFTNDLGADSLDTVELIMEIEKEFNISIPDEACEKMSNVGQLTAYLVERKCKK